jgi:putative transposase
MECHRYIELNPVRAGIVEDPADYPWSSFRHHALGVRDPLLSDHSEYLRLGATPAARIDAYGRFVRAAMPPSLLEEIRRALNKCRALGSDVFVAEIQRQLGRCARPREPGRPFRGVVVGKNPPEARNKVV